MFGNAYKGKLFRGFLLGIAASFLLLLLSNNFYANGSDDYSCYISEQGSGTRDGTALNNAYAWSEGAGLEQCLADVEAGDTIYLSYSKNYRLTKPIQWSKSGSPDQPIILQGAGNSASGNDFGRSVLRARERWPIITGTRSTTEGGEGGTNFIEFAPGVSYVKVQNLNLRGFNNVFSTGSRSTRSASHHVSLSDIYIEYAREVVAIFGHTEDEKDGDEVSRPYAWDVSRIYALGVSKRMVRAEGVKDSVFSDLYVDTKSPEGQIFWNDWPLLFHFSGGSNNIEVTRSIAQNPGQEDDDGDYDNGDCFTTESDTSQITFRTVRCFDAFDAAFDLKGRNHVIENAIAFRIGNRAFRIWHGPVTIRNAIAGFAAQGEYTRNAKGANAALWSKGDVTVEYFTSINNPQTFSVEDEGRIRVSKSIIALDRDHAADFTAAAEKEESESVVEENVVEWVEGRTGRDPQFRNMSNRDWNGEGNDFDSNRYRGQLGFRNVD